MWRIGKMSKCNRCKSTDIDDLFEIKYGLHNWFLCNSCSSEFFEWVVDKKSDLGCKWSKEYFKRKYCGYDYLSSLKGFPINVELMTSETENI